MAYSKIKEAINVKLVIAGSKDKDDKIDEIVESLNLRPYIVDITSPSDEIIINLYQNAKLFVFPSLFEGFGLPPLEALSLGCPVVASNIPVLREILGEKIACFNPYDIEDMIEKLLSAITNENSRIDLLKAGKNRLKLFDKDKIIDEHIDLFNEILVEGK
ncbi:glycosyltransferase [Desulfurella sp.]|uniref:glycosyltransferase n=1 Tax=Desulfurella sp. TaxID=1962857 RepID=UPI0025C40EED|nr:glycosyltransferase [Desulfurella sp.]